VSCVRVTLPESPRVTLTVRGRPSQSAKKRLRRFGGHWQASMMKERTQKRCCCPYGLYGGLSPSAMTVIDASRTDVGYVWRQFEAHAEVLEQPTAAEDEAVVSEVDGEGAGQVEAAPLPRRLQRTLTIEVRDFLQEFPKDGQAAGGQAAPAAGAVVEEAPLRELLDQWGRLERKKDQVDEGASPVTPGKKASKLQRAASVSRTSRSSAPGASQVSVSSWSAL
jgi:hypothetical protein